MLFYEINAVNTSLVVTDSIVIGGQRKRVEQIMTFKMNWLHYNYLQPLQQLSERLEREDLMRRQQAIREAENNRRRQEALRRQEEERRLEERLRRWRLEEQEERRRQEQMRQQESCVCVIL